MNIETVAANLRNKIAGKEQALQIAKRDLICGDYAGPRAAQEAYIRFVEINVDELKSILQDVEQCVAKVPYDEYTGE